VHIVHAIILRKGLFDGRAKVLIRGVGNAQDRGPGSFELAAKGSIVLGEVRGYIDNVH
jgi:hypothetical protein